MNIKRLVSIAILILFLIFCVMVFFLILNNKNIEKKNTFNYMLKQTDWKNKNEKETFYTGMMYDIINTFSYRQDSRYKKSMRKEERIKYVFENYKLAYAFSWGLFDVPIIHQMESCFNPYGEHLYSETGLGGIMMSTAKSSYNFCQKYMPRNLWKLVDFKLDKPHDLVDPINALKSSYMILWQEYRVYKGAENWSITGYHLGGFIYKHYENGKGDFPEKIILYTKYGKKTLNPKAYYFTWRDLKTAYENGDLESGKVIAEKWQKYRDSIKNEEYNYRLVRNRVKNLKKEIQNLKEVSSIEKIHIVNIELQLKHLEKDIKKIGMEANKTGWKKKTYDKFKSTLKNMLVKIKSIKNSFKNIKERKDNGGSSEKNK